MRRRIPYRVCSCMPNGVITHLEARLLRDMVNQAIHPIRCAASCRQKFMKGSRIGDLCAETGHFQWAMKVWGFTEGLIESKDWDDWRYVWFDNNRVKLTDVISETECELLSKRRSDLWRALGFPEEAWWIEEWAELAKDCFGSYYTGLWLDKFDYDPVSFTIEYREMLKECKETWQTEVLFREAQGEQPLCSQSFFDYWHGEFSADDYYE